MTYSAPQDPREAQDPQQFDAASPPPPGRPPTRKATSPLLGLVIAGALATLASTAGRIVDQGDGPPPRPVPSTSDQRALPSEPKPPTAGVDWASDDHAVAVVDADGKQLGRFTVIHTGKGLRVGASGCCRWGGPWNEQAGQPNWWAWSVA